MNEPENDRFSGEFDHQPIVLRAYMERWDGRRMIKLPYIDLFKAEGDNFLEGLEGYGKQEMGGGQTMVPPVPRESDTGAGLSEPPVGES